MSICGVEDLNFNKLKETTRYENYNDKSQTIIDFWDVMFSLDDQ